MKRPSKFDGEGNSLAGDVSPSPSAVPPGSNRPIPFPRSAAAALAAEGSEGAGVSSASASSFTLLGDLTHAVVLRLAGGYPRIKVRGAAEGGPAAPLDGHRAEGDRGD